MWEENRRKTTTTTTTTTCHTVEAYSWGTLTVSMSGFIFLYREKKELLTFF